MSWSGTGLPIASTTTNTLGNMILRTAECLKGLRYSTSTAAGTTTTLVDTGMTEPDEFFNGGTIFFLSGTLIGLSAVITDWDLATNTFTFSTQSGAPGSGVSYAALDANYPREALVQAINGALSELGHYPVFYNEAAFVTVADQEEYTLPAGVYNVKKVFIAANDAEPYEFQENFGWLESAGSLIFDMDTPAESDKRIRIYHEAPHPIVTEDSDAIMDCIHPELLAWTAAYRAALTRSGYAENSEAYTKELLSFAQQKSLQMRKHPIRHWQKASRRSGW